jgi:uncharacterized membrane protein YebE (DUF533 family)
MTDSRPLDHQTALIYVMVLAAAADSNMSEREMVMIGSMVDKLPVFEGFDAADLGIVAESCVDRLKGESALDDLMALITRSLPEKLRETAYALACEVVACDNAAGQEELRYLEMLRHEIDVDRLTSAAIERGIAALNRTL